MATTERTAGRAEAELVAIVRVAAVAAPAEAVARAAPAAEVDPVIVESGGRSGPGGSSGPRRPGTRRPGEGDGRGARASGRLATHLDRAPQRHVGRSCPEQIPVAEQLLRGRPARSTPGHRRPERSGEGLRTAPRCQLMWLLAMAYRLVLVVKLADWKDRATAAQLAGKDFRLRESRAGLSLCRVP